MSTYESLQEDARYEEIENDIRRINLRRMRSAWDSPAELICETCWREECVCLASGKTRFFRVVPRCDFFTQEAGMERKLGRRWHLYAALALNGLLANSDTVTGLREMRQKPQWIARTAAEIADAMDEEERSRR